MCCDGGMLSCSTLLGLATLGYAYHCSDPYSHVARDYQRWIFSSWSCGGDLDLAGQGAVGSLGSLIPCLEEVQPTWRASGAYVQAVGWSLSKQLTCIFDWNPT